MPFLQVNGAKLYYEDQGTGDETLVFAHSLLYNCRMFDNQVNLLKERYRCITYDFRGQGQSAVTASGYDMDTLTADTVALIEHLGCAPCHFVGFSMGGFVGMRLAIRHPMLLRSLTLIATSADPEPQENLPKYRLLNLLARWIGPWAVASQVMPIMFSQEFLRDPARAELRQTWRQHFVSNDRIGVTRAVTGVIERAGIYDVLGEIAVPTLILAGENDTATTPEKSARIHAAVADAQLVTVPRTGHMSPVEEPDIVNGAIVDFLATLR